MLAVVAGLGWLLVQQGHAAVGAQLDAVLGNLARQAGGFLLGLPLEAFTALVNLILLGFLSAYWLLGTPALTRFALSLLPERRHAAAAGLFGAMGQAMSGYVRGTAINSALIGLAVGVGLALAGVRCPVILGAMTMRRSTDIPQTLVIFAILAGAAVGGLLGLVVSIPLVAALRVFVLRVVVPVVRRWTGAAAGACRGA